MHADNGAPAMPTQGQMEPGRLLSMLAKQAIGAIMIGTVFVLLGLMPGPLAGMKREMRNFRASLSSLSNREPDIQSGRLPGQMIHPGWGTK